MNTEKICIIDSDSIGTNESLENVHDRLFKYSERR